MRVPRDRILLNRVDNRWHLQVLCLAEAEDFGLRGHLHLDFLGRFDTGQGLGPLLKGALIASIATGT